MKAYIDTYFEETEQIIRAVDRKQIIKAIEILKTLKATGGRLFILGVGGSAANASHAVNDFRKIAGIEAYAPTDNVSELTAWTNDSGFEFTFINWLKTSKLGAKDVVMFFSVGGGTNQTSKNLVLAMNYLKEVEAGMVAIVSRDGGTALKMADSCILVPVVSQERITPHAEGWQGLLWHLIVNAMVQETEKEN